MTIERLVVGGVRGLSLEQTVPFAQPDGRPGSGITVLVGTNNAGKSTIVEALRDVTNDNAPSFSSGKRNRRFGDRVRIRLETSEGGFREIGSVRAGGSQTVPLPRSVEADVVVVPSRRSFAAHFADTATMTRKRYGRGFAPPKLRADSVPNFAARLFELDSDEAKRREFDRLLSRVLGYAPEWAIDQNDQGSSYLKFLWSDADGSPQTHSSDGLGEGLVSLFVILDALRDSAVGSTVVVDEPELSLHPQFQRRLRAMLSEMSGDRQIVYATHSPYFIDWEDVHNGAVVNRVHKTADGTAVATPARATLEAFMRLGRNNLNNPHVLGLEANEVFFLEGGILLTEGQEDVLLLPKVVAELGFAMPWSFFGWGVGGAENMRVVCQLLDELGYDSVVGVLDNDKANLRDVLMGRYPGYQFECIPADDIRSKKARPGTPPKAGLVDETGRIRGEHVDATRELLKRVDRYFSRETASREIL